MGFIDKLISCWRKKDDGDEVQQPQTPPPLSQTLHPEVLTHEEPPSPPTTSEKTEEDEDNREGELFDTSKLKRDTGGEIGGPDNTM